MSETPFDRLRAACAEIADLGGACALLRWDEQTYLPPGGGESRGRQVAALTSILHEKVVSPRFDELLEAVRAGESDLTSDERAFVRELDFAREREKKLPTSLVTELALEESRSFEAWQSAKRTRSFEVFAPHLRRLLDLSRQKADCYGWEVSPWNALVEDYERGMTTAIVAEVFSPLRRATQELLDRIRSHPEPDTRFLEQTWPVETQRELGLRMARDLGFDFERGRQDVSAHPFSSTIGPGDVRITTRFTETDLLSALGSTVHEVGHALYEQGFRESDMRTPLAEAPSYGLHESQSRFWEILIGQSLPFWCHYVPILKKYFPGRLSDVAPEQFYAAVNRVKPGLIRTEADEVCYNLHIAIRFELEILLVEGDLPVEELPGEWNRRYEEYLGVKVPDDARGCLQDVHWAVGSFGYFPSYTFGNLYGAMFLEKMESDVAGLWEAVGRGDFSVPLGWLRQNIHQEGRRLLPLALVEKVSGRGFSAQPLIDHLNRKYGELYGL